MSVSRSELFQRRFCCGFLAFLVFFQSAVLYPQTPSVVPTIMQVYQPDVPLRIDQGSFFLAPGHYVDRFPREGQDKEYIGDVKIGQAVANLLSLEVMEGEVYRLHNDLVYKLQAIGKEQGENTQAYLEGLIHERQIPEVNVPGLGKAELTQVDGQFMVRVVHEATEVAFYILDEDKFSEDSEHFQEMLGRQYFTSGRSSLDRQRGRDVIFLWKRGSRNTRTVVSPRIQIRLLPGQKILHIFDRDPDQVEHSQRLHIRLYDAFMSFFNTSHPSSLRRHIRENRRLHRQAYRQTIWRQPDWNAVSFGIAKALFNASYVGGTVLLQEYVTGQNIGVWPPFCLAAVFSFTICSLGSTYRNWINMGQRNFLQFREHTSWRSSLADRFQDIDWEQTLKSRFARASVTSLSYAWLFLLFTDPRAENIASLPDLLWFFVLSQLIALPNFYLGNSNRITYMEQGEINERVGVSTGTWSPRGHPFPPFTWSLKNIDQLTLRYFFYDMSKIAHLLNPSWPLVSGTLASSLHTLGVSPGLLIMGIMLFLGKLITVRMVLGYHYNALQSNRQVSAYNDPMTLLSGVQGRLESRQAWSYLDAMARSRSTDVFLWIENMIRRLQGVYNSRHFPRQIREQLQPFLITDEDPSFLNEERQSDDLYYFRRWQVATQMQQRANEERNLLHERWQIDEALTSVENQFISYVEQTLSESNLNTNENFRKPTYSSQESDPVVLNPLFSPGQLRRQIRESFRNFAKVLHALSETLKATYFHTPSSPVFQGRDLPTETDTDFYEPIWERNNNVELMNILILFKENAGKQFPHLKQALDIVTREIQEEIHVDVERLQDVDVLNALLEDFDNFVDWHAGIVLSHIEEQQTRIATHRSGGMLEQRSHSYRFHLDLKERPTFCIKPLSVKSQEDL